MVSNSYLAQAKPGSVEAVAEQRIHEAHQVQPSQQMEERGALGVVVIEKYDCVTIGAAHRFKSISLISIALGTDAHNYVRYICGTWKGSVHCICAFGHKNDAAMSSGVRRMNICQGSRVSCDPPLLFARVIAV